MLSKTILFGLVASFLGATGLTAQPIVHNRPGDDFPSPPQPTEDEVQTAVGNRINNILREPAFLDNLIELLTGDQVPGVSLYFTPQGEMRRITLFENVLWKPRFTPLSQYRTRTGPSSRSYLENQTRAIFNQINIGNQVATLLCLTSDPALLRLCLRPLPRYDKQEHALHVDVRLHVVIEQPSSLRIAENTGK